MPNKYKVELTVLDDYESNGDDPYDVEDLKSDIIHALSINELEVEGEIKVIKLE